MEEERVERRERVRREKVSERRRDVEGWEGLRRREKLEQKGRRRGREG